MRKLLLALALATLPASVSAQAFPGPTSDAIETLPGPRRPPGEPGEQGPRRPALFVSPSGAPFRGGDGLAAWFAAADADHDGALSAQEFQADALRAFASFDTDGDGVVDGFEIQAYERERLPEIAEVALGEDRRGRRRRRAAPPAGEAAPAVFRGAGAQGAARFSLLNEPEPLLAADADVDGKVTRAEWLRATARRFAALDKAAAGKLTLASLRAPPARR
jgi:hypothetical protein